MVGERTVCEYCAKEVSIYRIMGPNDVSPNGVRRSFFTGKAFTVGHNCPGDHKHVETPFVPNHRLRDLLKQIDDEAAKIPEHESRTLTAWFQQ